MNKRTSFFLAVLLVTGVGAFAAQQVVEEIVAIVNDDVITLSQFRERYEMLVKALQAQFQGDELAKQVDFLRKNLLETMISETLLLQMAKEKQLDVREQLKSYIENIKKQNNIESDEDFKIALAREGLSYDTWVKQSQEDIQRQMIIYSEVDSHIVIDDNASMAYYKANAPQFVLPAELKLRAIVLPIEGATESALEAERQEISNKLAAHADFATLAGEYNHPGLKESQGDLGTLKRNELESTLGQEADKLKVGDVSPWFKARNSWYLLKLESRTDSRQRTFEEAKKEIEARLFQDKKGKALQLFFDRIRASNYVKILRPDPLGS
jgi:peptidyl-prolyl cis-trans isomerase SurA